MRDADRSEWFTAYGPAMLLFARQFTPSLPDAEDIVQQAFLRAFRRGNDSNRDADGLKAFLFSCVRTAALDQLRAARRRAEREGHAARSAPLFVAPPSEGSDFRAAVETSLVRLPPEQREVLVLKIWGDLTFEQIAATLQIPANTAASRYRSACEQLRQMLRKEVLK